MAAGPQAEGYCMNYCITVSNIFGDNVVLYQLIPVEMKKEKKKKRASTELRVLGAIQ